MKNITFTASATFTDEQVLYFAKSKGWTEENELSKEDFVKDWVKKKMIWIIGQPSMEAIKSKHKENQNNELKAYNEELSSIINVD